MSARVKLCYKRTTTRQLTWPSDHRVISSTGNSERYIEVVHSQCGRPKLATTAQKLKMMMRRVQTAAGESGGGEGALDMLDDSGASCVIFVSCNASAILARRLKVMSNLCGRLLFYDGSQALLLASRVNFVFTPLLTACQQSCSNQCIYQVNNTNIYTITRRCNGTIPR